MIFEAAIASNRLLRVAAKTVEQHPDFEPDLKLFVRSYLDHYCDYYRLEASDVVSKINDFAAQYLDDLAAFRATGLYPSMRGAAVSVGRVTYDVVLIVSCLVAPHRFAILERLARHARAADTLVIGCGSGLELALLRERTGCRSIEAFDISVSDFCRARNPNVVFRETAFVTADRAFQQAAAIELLEHLDKPFLLLGALLDAVPVGRVICTTAHNLPQFDHLYNFGESELDQWLAGRNQCAVVAEKIEHAMFDGSTDIYNKFYVIDRNERAA